MDKQKEKIFEDWRDSLGYDEQTLREYLDTIKAYIDFAEHYRSLSMPAVEQSEQFTPKQLYILAHKYNMADFIKILKEAPTWKG